MADVKKIKIRPRWPLDRFISGDMKFPPITAEGTELTSAQLQEAKKAAALAGVELVEIFTKEDGTPDERLVQDGD